MTQPIASRAGSVPATDHEVAVFAVDDHAPFRAALRELMARTHGFALVGEACSGEEAIQAVAKLSPQLVLLDVRMPGLSGPAAARQILERCPGVTIVLMSVGDPSLHDDVRSLGPAVLCVRKQELCPFRLRELWAIHGKRDLGAHHPPWAMRTR